MMRGKDHTLAIVGLLVLSVVAPFVAFSGTAAAGPPGFVTVGGNTTSEKVTPGQPAQGQLPEQAGPPPHAQLPEQAGPPPHALEHIPEHALENVLASRTSMQVQVAATTEDDLALVVTDDQESAAGEVAIPLEVFDGEPPEMAYGIHESGEEWDTTVTVEDGYAILEIPHFSTQTVTFEGEVQVSGTYTSDSEVQYELTDPSQAENPTLDLTGITNTESETVSSSGVSPSHSQSISVGGNGEVIGESTSEPQLSVTGYNVVYDLANRSLIKTENLAPDGSQLNEKGIAPNSFTFADNGSSMYIEDGDITRITLTDPYNISTTDTLQTNSVSGGEAAGIDLSPDGTTMYTLHGDNTLHEYTLDTPYDVSTATETDSTTLTNTGAGEQIDFADDGGKLYVTDSFNEEIHEYTLSTDYDISTASHSSTFTSSHIGVSGLSVGQDGEVIYYTVDGQGIIEELSLSTPYDLSTATVSETESGVDDDGSIDLVGGGKFVSAGWGYGGYAYSIGSKINDLSVSDGAGNTVSFEEFDNGETKTVPIDLSTTSTEINFSSSGGDSIDYSLDYVEQTKTENPGVGLNVGTENESWANHTGTLADGETVSLELDSANLQEGTNTLDVSTAQLSADAPAMQVELNYSHGAPTTQTVEVDSEKFTERTEVSHTWGGDREDAEIVVTFGSNVLEMRDLTVTENGSEISPTTSMEGTDLHVDLGTVQKNTTHTVVANGSKIQVDGGSVTVTDPTLVGDALDSAIRLDSWSNESHIAVGSVDLSSQTVHAVNESWASPEEYVWADSGGAKHLHMPQAGDGSTARLQTVPVDLQPETGDATIRVVDSSEIRVSVGPGEQTGDTIKLGWYDVTSGESYQLIDEGADEPVDSATANSPVWFTISDEDAVYTIESYVDSTAPTGVGSTGDDGDGGLSSSSLLLVGAFLLVLIVVVVLGRVVLGMDGRRQTTGLLVGGAVTGTILLEFLAPTSLIGLVLYYLDRAFTLLVLEFADSPALSLVLPVLALATLYVVDRLTDWIPTWLYAAVGGLSALWALATFGILQALGAGISGAVLFVLNSLGAFLGVSFNSLASFLGGSAGVILTTVLVMMGLYAVDRRYDAIPTWLYLISGGLLGIWTLNTITEGALAEGLGEVSPLLWLIGGLGMFALLYQALSGPDIIIGGEQQ